MTGETKYLTLTKDNFQREVLEETKLVLVVFSADWCGPCHMIAPVIEGLVAEFHGLVKVAKVDVDHNPSVATEYGIRSTPTLLFFKDGRVVDTVVGVAPKNMVADKVHAVLQSM